MESVLIPFEVHKLLNSLGVTTTSKEWNIQNQNSHVTLTLTWLLSASDSTVNDDRSKEGKETTHCVKSANETLCSPSRRKASNTTCLYGQSPAEFIDTTEFSTVSINARSGNNRDNSTKDHERNESNRTQKTCSKNGWPQQIIQSLRGSSRRDVSSERESKANILSNTDDPNKFRDERKAKGKFVHFGKCKSLQSIKNNLMHKDKSFKHTLKPTLKNTDVMKEEYKCLIEADYNKRENKSRCQEYLGLLNNNTTSDQDFTGTDKYKDLYTDDHSLPESIRTRFDPKSCKLQIKVDLKNTSTCNGPSADDTPWKDWDVVAKEDPNLFNSLKHTLPPGTYRMK